jgi:hypothetical protein
MMRQVFFKTIPRSGHHFLSTLVYTYFGDDVRYCFRAEACCNQIPCNRPGPQPLLMHKSHDEALSDPWGVPGVAYLIQVREPAGQIASEIERFKLRAGDAFPIDDPSYAEWWLARSGRYYRAFIARWVANLPSGALLLDYARLLAEPEASLAAAIRLFGREPDPARVAEVVAGQRGRLARNPMLDHENRPFAPRASVGSDLLPPGLFEDYVALASGVEADTRLSRAAVLLDRIAEAPVEVLPALAEPARALGNPHVVRDLGKRLIKVGRAAEGKALLRA